MGKWQTSDPLGYPDGWNAFAYCGNACIDVVDLWGALTINIVCNGQEASKGITCQGVAGLGNIQGGYGTLGNSMFVGASYDGDNDEVTINYTCQYNTLLCKPNGEIEKGTINSYTNHVGDSCQGGIFGGSPVLDEAVIAHEIAHVQAVVDYFGRSEVIAELAKRISNRSNNPDHYIGRDILFLMDTYAFNSLNCSYSNAASSSGYQNGWKEVATQVWLKE